MAASRKPSNRAIRALIEEVEAGGWSGHRPQGRATSGRRNASVASAWGTFTRRPPRLATQRTSWRNSNGRAGRKRMMEGGTEVERYETTFCGVLVRTDAGDHSPKGPVSYTHLRVHETRHDLVCRLLLE